MLAIADLSHVWLDYVNELVSQYKWLIPHTLRSTYPIVTG